MEKLHYLTPASLNEPKRLTTTRSRARKRPMQKQLNLTFKQLKERMAEQTHRHSESVQSLANLVSALHGFLQERGFSDETVVGSIFRASYYKNRDAHITELQRQGKSASYIANRKSYLARWRNVVITVDQEYAAQSGTASPLQNALHELFSDGFPKKRVAAQAGISIATLKRWLAGAKPNERARPALMRLERFFGVIPGELLTLAGLVPTEKSLATAGEPPSISYRERLRAAVRFSYALKDPSDALRVQWQAFLRYKTAPTTTPTKARQKNGKWSTTTVLVERRKENNWYAFLGPSYVATASVRWQAVAQYLGWLRMPADKGGYGLPDEEVQTLAHLADCQSLHQYINWRIVRADENVHEGVIGFVKFVKSLCHPASGYLTFTPELSATVGLDAAEWVSRCAEAFEFAKSNLGALQPQQRGSRDSFEPLQSILDLPNPMDAVADAIQRLNASRPSTGGITEAIWARDRLSLKLLASNPLRAKNFKFLMISTASQGKSYSSQSVSQLYRAADGWRINVDRRCFKNANGAAKDRDYDMPVQASVWADIETYLQQYRPLLASPKSPYLFASSEPNSDGAMYGFNRRIELLTRRYFWRCPGFGPHGFRYIVATAILKQSPNDWTTAALVLHDRVETVEKHYAHLRSQDGAERQFAILASSYSRM